MQVHQYNEKSNYKTINPGDVILGNKTDTPLTIRMKSPTIPYSNLVICDDTYHEERLEEYKRDDYNIFSGSIVNVTTKNVFEEINSVMKELCEVLLQFMNAGYHLYSESEKNKEIYNKARIDDWIINFEYPMLKMFKIYFGIKTSCEDILFADEFLDNPQFRYMITDIVMKVIYNYGFGNLNVKGNWDTLDVYQHIYGKL